MAKLNENAKVWVEALRSGEFTQGKRALKTEKGEFCCLGVACELYSRSHPEAKWVEDTIPQWTADEKGSCLVDTKLRVFVAGPDDQSDGLLPLAVMQWLGLTSSAGYFDGKDGPRSASLASENDSGKTFAEIADIIESHPEIFEERKED